MNDAFRPYTLVAELTYRCPLRCAYCSNPLDWSTRPAALGSAEWAQVFRDAAALGAVQLHLTGGEPLLRADLEELVAAARAADLYTHLVTSGVPLGQRRLRELRDAGLDALQLSLQDVEPGPAGAVAGAPVAARKRAVARWVRDLDLPLTINVVLHRNNIDRLADIVALAEDLGADRLELANAQYLGWALVNRRALLPSRQQLERARAVAATARQRLAGRIEIVFVLPDYHAGRPRACMDGWGRRFIVVTADGLVLPCHAAHTIEGLAFERVGERPLGEIWRDSPGLNAFRGEAWMPAPCRSCERRAVDYGGCRCQAYHLTGDPAMTDPACSLSPAHHLVLSARMEAERQDAPVPLRLRSRKP